MPVLNINGRKVTVDDSFLSMPPDQQNSAVEEIVGSLPPQSAMDKLTGTNGPRYQTWPERAVRGLFESGKEAAMLPGRVMQEAAEPKTEISDSDASAMSIPAVMGLAAASSPVNPAVRAGERAIPGMASAATKVKSEPKVPTAEELQTAAQGGYTAARDSGLKITPEAVTGFAGKIRSQLEQDGIFDQLAPKTFSIIEKASSAPAGSYASVANLEAIRRSLQHAARDFGNPTEQLAASRVIKGLDELLGGLSAKDTMAGAASAAPGVGAISPPIPTARPSAEDVAGTLRNARGNYAAAMRSNDLTGNLDRAKTGILERAQGRAQAANSGRNLDNTIRQKVEALLEKPKEVSGYSDKELEALNGVVAGGGVRNTARYIGNLLGGGGGMGQFGTGAVGAGVGGAYGGLTGAAIGATPAIVGAGSKVVANALAKRSLNKADELVRKRSPLYEEALAKAETIPAHLSKKAAIAKMLLMEALQQ